MKHRAGLIDRPTGEPVTQLPVVGVAQRHLEVPDIDQGGGRRLRVPLIQTQCQVLIATRRRGVPREPGLPQPRPDTSRSQRRRLSRVRHSPYTKPIAPWVNATSG